MALRAFSLYLFFDISTAVVALLLLNAKCSAVIPSSKEILSFFSVFLNFAQVHPAAERMSSFNSLCYSLWQHLGHICCNTRSPVSSLYVVFLEAQSLHQLVKYPSSCKGIKTCTLRKAPHICSSMSWPEIMTQMCCCEGTVYRTAPPHSLRTERTLVLVNSMQSREKRELVASYHCLPNL